MCWIIFCTLLYCIFKISSCWCNACMLQHSKVGCNVGCTNICLSRLYCSVSKLTAHPSAQKLSCHCQLLVTVRIKNQICRAPDHVNSATANHSDHIIRDISCRLSKTNKMPEGAVAEVSSLKAHRCMHFRNNIKICQRNINRGISCSKRLLTIVKIASEMC